jgi:hypothetical protein
MLKDKIEKKNQLKKTQKNNSSQPGFNLPNSRPESWDQDNLIKKIEINYETQFLINSILKDEIKKND